MRPKKPTARSVRVWSSLFVAVLAVELFSLFDTTILGRDLLDPLTRVVVYNTWKNPETFGSALVLGIVWALVHFTLWPMIRKVRGEKNP